MAGFFDYFSPVYDAASIAFTPTDLNVGEDQMLAFEAGYDTGHSSGQFGNDFGDSSGGGSPSGDFG